MDSSDKFGKYSLTQPDREWLEYCDENGTINLEIIVSNIHIDPLLKLGPDHQKIVLRRLLRHILVDRPNDFVILTISEASGSNRILKSLQEIETVIEQEFHSVVSKKNLGAHYDHNKYQYTFSEIEGLQYQWVIARLNGRHQMKEVVKNVYDGLNRNDIPEVMKLFDPDIVRIEFENTPMAGTFRGLKEVEPHFNQGRSSWAEGSCEPEKLLAGQDKVMAFVYVRVRLKDKTEWLEGRTGDVFTFRNGKVTEFRTFEHIKDALEYSGLKE